MTEAERHVTDLPPAEQALLRETRRDFDRATKVPGDLVRRIAGAVSQAQAAWVAAREARDFKAFLPHVRSLLELKTEYAHTVGVAEVPLDALGELMPLREWLRAKIHVHGRSAPPRQLIANATGKEPSQDAFMRYARAKFGEVYGIDDP